MLALTLGSLTYGYTFSITSTTLGQPGWYLFFDLSSEATGSKYSYTQAITGTMNGLFCAGGFLGSIFIGWSCDAMGRKNSLWIASPLAILGGALQAGAVHIGMFLIGRFIGGFAVGRYCKPFQSNTFTNCMILGILIVLIPLFQAEIAPPAARGFLVSQHGRFLLNNDQEFSNKSQALSSSWVILLPLGPGLPVSSQPISLFNGDSRLLSNVFGLCLC